ncbi:MAG: hypothetical protein KatS3mg026_0648 [Bacteroidia bacterium]|nr:MAG: hypothetical protein KatS3mg026_0648 [Bacteroidia bacterium]
MTKGSPSPPKASFSWRKWLKRGGIGLFLFFLLKGLAWLIVPALMLYFCGRS